MIPSLLGLAAYIIAAMAAVTAAARWVGRVYADLEQRALDDQEPIGSVRPPAGSSLNGIDEWMRTAHQLDEERYGKRS